MSMSSGQLHRLRNFIDALRRNDPELGQETAELEYEVAQSEASVQQGLDNESIAMRALRPVLYIKGGTCELVFVEQPDSEVWRARLARSKGLLDKAIPAVGRITAHGYPGYIGTGWLVADEIVVTNRHVADEFAMRKGEGFAFRSSGGGEPMTGAIDFLQEAGSDATCDFRLARPLYISDPSGPDVAFFAVDRGSGNRLAGPIALSAKPALTESAATIGYPASDSRIPEYDLMTRIYQGTYNKKRLAPGAVVHLDGLTLQHNCTTLGGNSGSTVIDLDSGDAIGLHFSGKFMTANYAVRSDVVKKLLEDARSGRVRRVEPRPPSAGRPGMQARAATAVGNPPVDGGSTASVTIPLTVTITVSVDGAPVRPRPSPLAPGPSANADDIAHEAVASDYDERAGYLASFLGKNLVVDLPTVERDAGDVLSYDNHGKADTVLRYEHFSVVMSESRRMCFFSACNIDGSKYRKNKRAAWKWDPRISKTQQIMKECYGDPPKFSRGHMTRREDPGWGDPTTARRGNEDSMHVTNTTPQMQAFNAPIWLGLEDHALGHAVEDDMKICVFTGPYLDPDDPVMYGVQIPRAFWKIIAFVHDETGRLCATGYEMNQESAFETQEYVFGAYRSPQLGIAAQVPITAIELRSGISFGKLAQVDPLAGGTESTGGGRIQLLTFEQIRFV